MAALGGGTHRSFSSSRNPFNNAEPAATHAANQEPRQPRDASGTNSVSLPGSELVTGTGTGRRARSSERLLASALRESVCTLHGLQDRYPPRILYE